MSVLPKLRCPDCLVPRVHEESATPDVRVFACDSCGRTMELRDGILEAMPSQFARETASNISFYDEMSADPSGQLFQAFKMPKHQKKLRTVVETLGLQRGGEMRVLEVGVGLGVHGEAIRALGHDYTGLDASRGLLERAIGMNPDLQECALVHGDAQTLPFADRAFDCVFCVATLHHLPDPKRGLEEMMRVLSPGGRFCFVEPKPFYPGQILQAATHPKSEMCWYKVSAGSVRRWASAGSPEEVNVTHRVYPPYPPGWSVRMLAADMQSGVFCVFGVK